MAVVDKRVSAADFADRSREREQRSAADTRTILEKLLGDPPRDQSALAQHKRVKQNSI